MANSVYNLYLTTGAFSEGDTFLPPRGAHILYDERENVLGSINGRHVYDLNGNKIADCTGKAVRACADNGTERVWDFASQTRTFRLVGNRFYTVDGEDERLTGHIRRSAPNVPRIVVLSALAALLIAAIILIALIGMPTGGTTVIVPPNPDIYPTIAVSDAQGDWEAQETVGVFGDSLKPGDSGEYGFIIENPNELPVRYEFYIEPQYEGNVQGNFPIRFRLRMNNVLIQTEAWRTVDELRFDGLEIMSDTKQSFTLEWEWPFAGGADENDTLFGRDGGKISLMIHLTAQQAV